LLPDGLDIRFTKPIIIAKVLVKYPGVVDSIYLYETTGDSVLDSLIVAGLKRTRFFYPDTTYGYPHEEWINIPIKCERIFRKSLFDRLKFW